MNKTAAVMTLALGLSSLLFNSAAQGASEIKSFSFGGSSMSQPSSGGKLSKFPGSSQQGTAVQTAKKPLIKLGSRPGKSRQQMVEEAGEKLVQKQKSGVQPTTRLNTKITVDGTEIRIQNGVTSGEFACVAIGTGVDQAIYEASNSTAVSFVEKLTWDSLGAGGIDAVNSELKKTMTLAAPDSLCRKM